MTTRVIALTVLLDGTPRNDDVESLMAAIRQLRGVGDVVSIGVNGEDMIAYYKARFDLQKQVFQALQDILTH